MFVCRLLTAIFLILSLAGLAEAKGLTPAKKPEEVGLSGEKLKKLSAWIQDDVEKKVIPGAVVILMRQGKVGYFEAFGFRDREKNIPMTRDSIFRIASMTKPFTSLAIMMLAEEGKIQLPYPVSRYLPEFKDMKVGIDKKDEAAGKMELVLEPARREMTVQDLMRHTSGLTYGIFGKSLVKDQYNAASALDRNQTNAEMVTKLSKIPLQCQPGEVWEYSMSTDVLARIVEVVSGVDFNTFVFERISKPLKLTDTGFFAETPDQLARVAEPQVDPATGKKPPMAELKERPKWFSGGGGMISTASDYARFCQTFLNGGVLEGVRLASRKTIELMTADHLPPGIKFGPFTPALFAALSPTPEMGQGFSLAFGVRTEAGRNPLPGSIGDYYWGGAQGTYFWIDPKEKLAAVLMMQAPAQRLHYRYLLRYYVYQALR
ncbi:MAG: beta-lactamase family protein [Deltaproteobacteria bacterium]|nr:beta-lactamase family protein [Deltaproteobacteria bacterium]